jgi:hypothetical protein
MFFGRLLMLVVVLGGARADDDDAQQAAQQVLASFARTVPKDHTKSASTHIEEAVTSVNK